MKLSWYRLNVNCSATYRAMQIRGTPHRMHQPCGCRWVILSILLLPFFLRWLSHLNTFLTTIHAPPYALCDDAGHLYVSSRGHQQHSSSCQKMVRVQTATGSIEIPAMW